MCVLSVEWSETILSCGGNATLIDCHSLHVSLGLGCTSPTDSSEYGKLLDQVCMRSSHQGYLTIAFCFSKIF